MCVVSRGEDNQSSNADRDTDGHDTGNVVGVELETMDSQPAFITDRHPHQSVSVGNDMETELSDSLCIVECCNDHTPYQPQINYSKGNKGNVVNLFNHLGMDLLNGLVIA